MVFSAKRHRMIGRGAVCYIVQKESLCFVTKAFFFAAQTVKTKDLLEENMNKMTRQKTLTLLFALALTLSLAACQSNKAPDTTKNPPSDTIEVIDREGKTLQLPKQLNRIISMAPSITETLVHLGLADRIIAVDKYSVGIAGLPEGLPTFDLMTPDTETMAQLQPDIIFATGMSRANSEDPFRALTDLGITMTYIPSSSSIDAIKEDIRFLGKTTGTEDKATTIVSDMEAQIAAIVEKIGDQKSAARVYFEIGSDPKLYSFGANTFLNEIITLLGAQNILGEQDSWVAVSEETVLQKNPEVIFTNVDYVEDPVGGILTRNGWESVSAVQNQKVFLINKNASSRSNEYITIAIKEMAQALYPELFAAT